MSVTGWFRTSIAFRKKEIIPTLWARRFCTEPERSESEQPESQQTQSEGKEGRNRFLRPDHPLEKCLEYMDSKAYEYTYGDKPVWHVYVRNFKGPFPPQTRKSCTRKGLITTGNPCPICRDQYLLPHYRNIKLLKQFLSPQGQILNSKSTGVCQLQHFNLIVAIKKAQNYGLLPFTVPHRSYDYSFYNKK